MAKHIFSMSLQSPTSVAQRGYLQPQTTWYVISISLASVKCLLLYICQFSFTESDVFCCELNPAGDMIASSLSDGSVMVCSCIYGHTYST